MKIYRIVPDSFATNKKINSEKLTGVEDIYYKMGYTSFLGKRGFHDFNTLTNCREKEGKYFYLFAEDAILEGNNLIGGYHRLRMDTCLIVEYDVPEDIILKNIGYGDYTEGILPLHLVESYIEKSNLGTEIVTTDELSKELKLENLIESLNDSLSIMKEYKISAWDDVIFYINHFEVSSLEQIINDNSKLKNAILSSSFYHAFINEKGTLIKSPYITGKIAPINMGYISKKLGNYNKIAEYYQNFGFNCDFTKEQEQLKKDLLYYLNQEKKDTEEIKHLLKERKK